jgi:hypothetical protein
LGKNAMGISSGCADGALAIHCDIAAAPASAAGAANSHRRRVGTSGGSAGESAVPTTAAHTLGEDAV